MKRIKINIPTEYQENAKMLMLVQIIEYYLEHTSLLES